MTHQASTWTRIVATAAVVVLVCGCRRDKVVDTRFETVLQKSEQRRLNDLAQQWIAAELAWGENPRQPKEARETARRAFVAALGKLDESTVLSHVGDLLAIFDNVFPYRERDGDGETHRVEGRPVFHVKIPKSYDKDQSFPSVLVLRGKDPNTGKWATPHYLDSVWRGALAFQDTVLVLPELIDGVDYDEIPDLTSDRGRLEEGRRIKAALSVFGEVQRTYRLDRRRRFLDCGRGSCGFGLRLATYFPSMFAGVILRHPVDIGSFRLNSLVDVPILMIATPETQGACSTIQAKLQSDDVTVLKGEGRAPFVNAAPAIDRWMQWQKRPLFPTEVTIAPTNDRFRSNHWVEIISCELLDAVAEDDRPLVRAKADRKRNAIIIDSHNVREIGLRLNDALVDLDKKVRIIVNGKTIANVELERSVKTVQRHMIRAYDSTWLYSAYYRFEIEER